MTYANELRNLNVKMTSESIGLDISAYVASLTDAQLAEIIYPLAGMFPAPEFAAPTADELAAFRTHVASQ